LKKIKYELELSAETWESLEAMVKHCLNRCIAMGMDKGYNEDGSPSKIRKELTDIFDSSTK
jgi:hypothetical protein